MKTLLETLIADFQARDLPFLVPRTVPFRTMSGKISTVIGMRRSGKTWFCFQQMKALLEEKVEKQRILYLNFDDERLQPMRQEDLRLIPEGYYRLFPENKKCLCHFYFDEIQNIPGWELFVRRLLDSENVRIVLTGSSAKLLSREIATSLRGRALTTEIFPYSFTERLSHLGIPIPSSPFSSAARAQMESAFSTYLSHGGFPETVGVDDPMRLRILQDYVDVVLFRDVVERHGVGNILALRYLARHLLNAVTAKFSINKFYRSLQSQGVQCGRDVLHDWLDHLSDAYLVFPVTIHTRSKAVRRVNPSKIYAVDTALIEAVRHRAAPDQGALLENTVFLALRRNGLTIEYHVTDSGHEVDFLVESPDGSPRLIQVCADMSEKTTRDRELRALRQAMEETGLSSGTIISMFQEETLTVDGRRIEVIPAWRWLLEDPLLIPPP